MVTFQVLFHIFSSIKWIFLFFSVGHLVRHSNIFCRTFIENVRLSDRSDEFRQHWFSIIESTGRVVRYLRADRELSATGRAVHGPSCPWAELSGYQHEQFGNFNMIYLPYLLQWHPFVSLIKRICISAPVYFFRKEFWFVLPYFLS